MTIQQKIKEVLINLAIEDKLPLDLNDLDPTVFDPVIEPLLEKLKNNKETN